jgi:hypothetical protein
MMKCIPMQVHHMGLNYVDTGTSLYNEFKWDGDYVEFKRLHEDVFGKILNSNFTMLVDWTFRANVSETDKYRYSSDISPKTDIPK